MVVSNNDVKIRAINLTIYTYKMWCAPSYIFITDKGTDVF